MEAIIDFFVKDIARLNDITVPEASKKLDHCLKTISAKENIEYSKLYNLLTVSGLSFCLKASCNKTILEECEKLCHCVIYQNKCVPRYIPKANLINQDPDKFIVGMSTKDLEELVKYASYLYYNYDGGGLTDNSFDALEYSLNKRLKLKGRRWEKIGAEPIEKLRVKLPIPMPSLPKVKPETRELRDYINNNKIVWSDKLDGVSGLVVYSNGEIKGIYSRGDGEIGGNLTYLKDYINFPKVKGNLVVRGEFILPKKVWESKYTGSYANPRSFVSAKINGGHVSPAFGDIDFVAYSIPESSTPDKDFKTLDSLGFKTPVNGVFTNPVTFDLIEKYLTRRAESEYNIDGLVIQVPGAPAKAFKMLLEEQLRDTKVINVEWNITRYGRFFPVAIYESVYIDGVRLHRASAHNAQHVQDWHLGKNSQIRVARSGDVIPQIKDVQVDTTISPIFPPEEPWSWHWERKDIVLDLIETNPEVQIKRNTHFFTTIKVPGLGEGRIRKLYEAGLTELEDITNAPKSRFQKIKGFGPKLSEDLYNNIQSVMEKTRMDRYLIALTTFKTKISRKIMKDVVRRYPEIFSDSPSEIKKKLTKIKIPGIGAKRIDDLSTGIPEFVKELKKLNDKAIEKAIKWNSSRKVDVNPKIKDKIFVLTNFLNTPSYDLEDYIWDNWGEISNSVTSSTTAVIANNFSTITPKMLTAGKLMIPVYTIEEFFEKFQ